MAEWLLRWKDEFKGPALDENRWVGGHVNESREATIGLDEGLHIRFIEGREYASAGLVLRDPVVGDFDARVRFTVTSPGPGRTFELAAIAVDPPREAALNAAQANNFTRSRVYEVHGAPPYVSAELDEDDGWRIGWNRGSAQTVPDRLGNIISDNHFNRYGRNVGPKPSGVTTGWLRLVRIAGDWTSYRLDEQNAWRPVGEVKHMNLPDPVFLRVASKHWLKRREGGEVASANHVQFHSFEIHGPPPQ